MFDFEDYATFQYMQSIDQNYYKEKTGNEYKYYKRKEERYGESLYKEVEEVVTTWYNVIGERKPSGSFKVHKVLKPMVWPIQHDISPPFNVEITKAIEKEEAITASDATKKDASMAGHWIFIDLQRK